MPRAEHLQHRRQRHHLRAPLRADPARALAAGGLVGWAHWRVGAPTVAQAVVTTILAVVITAGTFWLMRVPVAFLK